MKNIYNSTRFGDIGHIKAWPASYGPLRLIVLRVPWSLQSTDHDTIDAWAFVPGLLKAASPFVAPAISKIAGWINQARETIAANESNEGEPQYSEETYDPEYLSEYDMFSDNPLEEKTLSAEQLALLEKNLPVVIARHNGALIIFAVGTTEMFFQLAAGFLGKAMKGLKGLFGKKKKKKKNKMRAQMQMQMPTQTSAEPAASFQAPTPPGQELVPEVEGGDERETEPGVSSEEEEDDYDAAR